MTLLAAVLCVPALAVTESEVEAQVAATSKSEVAGNVLIWFLCAIAFLKVSQKIDSFMASLGVNVGRTGGSLMAEAMVAMRAVTMVAGGGHRSGGRSSPSGSGASGSGSSSDWFLKGGLAGVVSRHVTNSAVKTATTQTSAVHTAQSSVRQAAAAAATNAPAPSPDAPQAAGTSIQNDIRSGGVNLHAGGGSPVDSTAPQEGVIIADTGAPAAVPVSQDIQPGGSGVDVSHSSSITNDIHPGGASITTMGASPAAEQTQEGVIVAGSDVPPDAVQPTDTTVVAPDGALLNIPPVSDSHAPESVSEADGSAAYPDDGAVLNIPAADAPIPAAPPHDGSTAVVSQTENASVQENVSVAGGGSVLTFPQTGGVTPPTSVNTPSPQEGVVVTGGERHTNTQTASSSQSSTNSQTVQSSTVERSHTTVNRSQHSRVTAPSLGGMIFSKSLASGGSFANDVIGTVARGEVAGSITGEMAAQSLTSYMGYTAIKESSRDIPTYSDVEIGRGRITGVEATAGSTDGLPFAMYHVGQYDAPSGEFQKVFSADGTQWYKQYAQDTVERKPYKAPDDTVAYHEKIVKKLPNPPRRKDRM